MEWNIKPVLQNRSRPLETTYLVGAGDKLLNRYKKVVLNHFHKNNASENLSYEVTIFMVRS